MAQLHGFPWSHARDKLGSRTANVPWLLSRQRHFRHDPHPCQPTNSRKPLPGVHSEAFEVPVGFQAQLAAPAAPPGLVFPHGLLAGETADADHEHPGHHVHDHPSQLDVPAGPGRCQLAVHQPGSHPDAHTSEEHHEEEIHQVAREGVVLAQLLEEPAGLQQRVGDLAAEDDGVDVRGRLAQRQRGGDAHDADQVVGQHQGSLRLEVCTPAQVEDEVAQAEAQPVHLEGGVGCP